jgi:hypothetical protein
LFKSGYPQQRQGAFFDLSDAFPGDALDGRDLIEGMRLVAVEPEPGSQDGRLYAGKVERIPAAQPRRQEHPHRRGEGNPLHAANVLRVGTTPVSQHSVIDVVASRALRGFEDGHPVLDNLG